MTKSTITRERLEWLSQISCRDDIEDIGGDEIRELASMALAAMDSSESVELPLDYLQGHKDGLEWAAQLAEANHHETGDWLYDDPIELAKAIRKGPDMPPAQPAADSEPVAWTWQHLKQWHVTNDEERARDLAWDGVKVEPLYRRAAMLQDGTLTNEGTKQAWTGIPDIDNAINMLDRIDTLDSCDDDRIEAVKTVLRGLAGNSQVIPDGYVMVPKEPTERMVIDGFESEPDETFSEPEVWEAFQKMSGCEQAAYRARLCWAAMLAAAPQEVRGE
ncbi:hypothetical protein ACWJN6_28325 [Klebsiella pneumoniae]|uniref:hypothetical protein n=1 Tax=Klebsiella pneumoniae TaxID=573 RepID=UPI003593F239